ncbi:MAG: tRNA guanosine(15) transglycosylase TgtA, partial [Sulfolobales archaeon]|nr:tRNA guanosine(15) transglycosylase TgtA [Sulfolobales archaeon]MDW8010252.1 tRNA guanosine(15) transglycosylase TgtA [Sulfolobales archaeon]
DLAGRIARLELRSGTIETPAFFPVVHPFKQSEDLPIEKIVELGFRQVITNAYIIKRKVEGRRVRVHEVLNFSGVVMTDSGAYQLLIYGTEKVSIDPVELVEFEEVLEPDVAVIVDIPTSDTATVDEARASAEETLRRAYLSLEVVKRSSDRIAWVLPVQGGVHLEVLRWSALESRKLSEFYSLYAVGSPVKALEKYDFRKVLDMVFTVKSAVPADKPVHLFGGGHPLLIPFAVAMGIDSFDSASYILYARDDRYMTEYGTFKLDVLSYLPCSCPVCGRFEPRDLLDMSKSERTRLLAEHNLSVIAKSVREVKEAIKEGRLWELLERLARSHPAARDAFGRFIKYVDWVEKLDSRFRGAGRGILLVETTSYYRPELIRHRVFLKEYLKYALSEDHAKPVVLLPGDLRDRPFIESRIYRKVVEVLRRRGRSPENYVKLVYVPFFNLVPAEISHTYPYSQCEISHTSSRKIADKMFRAMVELVKNTRSEVAIFTCSKYYWSRADVVKKNVCSLADCSRVDFVEICET